MNKEEKESYWAKQVSAFRKSGEEKKEWCEKNDISLQRFNYYLKQESKKQWVPVEIKQEKVFSPTPLVIKIGSVSVEVSPGFEKAHLQDVLEIVKAL